jgi:hypothetical protein
MHVEIDAREHLLPLTLQERVQRLQLAHGKVWIRDKAFESVRRRAPRLQVVLKCPKEIGQHANCVKVVRSAYTAEYHPSRARDIVRAFAAHRATTNKVREDLSRIGLTINALDQGGYGYRAALARQGSGLAVGIKIRRITKPDG